MAGSTHNGKRPEYPLVSRPLDGEPKEKRRKRHPDGEHERPHANVPRALLRKEHLLHGAAAQRRGRGDEEGAERPARRQRAVCTAAGAAHVAGDASQKAQHVDGQATVALGQRVPEERRDAEDGDLQRRHVRRRLDGDAQPLRDVLEGGDDGGCGKGADARVKRHEGKVDEFLREHYLVSLR